MLLWSENFNGISRDIDLRQHSEYWLKGGRGSGKSTFIARKILLGLLSDRDANAVVYRRVGNTLRQSVYEEFAKAVDALGIRPWCRFRLSPLEIRLASGQRILFFGADDPAKSKSISIAQGYFGHLWFEELAEFRSMEDVDTIRASIIRGGQGARPVTYCSYNPPMSAQNWVNMEALAPREGRYVHHSTYLEMPKGWIGQSFIDNAEAIRAANERAYRHMYLGEVTGTGGQVFENLTLRPITGEEIKGFGHTYAGLDWGWYPDPTHFVRCAFDAAQRRLWVYDEWRANKTANIDIYRHLTAQKGLTRAEEVIADSAEMKSVNDMRSYGMRCVAATKGPGSVRTRIKWLQSLSEIVIDPARCPFGAREFSQYEYERNREGQPVEAYPDRDNHAIDAVGYATNRIWLQSGM